MNRNQADFSELGPILLLVTTIMSILAGIVFMENFKAGIIIASIVLVIVAIRYILDKVERG